MTVKEQLIESIKIMDDKIFSEMTAEYVVWCKEEKCPVFKECEKAKIFKSCSSIIFENLNK